MLVLMGTCCGGMYFPRSTEAGAANAGRHQQRRRRRRRWRKRGILPASARRAFPEKSIAVLPFENLSEEGERFFTRGVQDEILTDLPRCRLKMISPLGDAVQTEVGAKPARDRAATRWRICGR